MFPEARIDPDVLFVEDDHVVTSAGTAAGIDACLHHVRCELGAGVANKIARRMVVPPQRDGGQRQYIDLPVPDCYADSLSPLLAWMREHLAEDLPIRALAARAAMSERTFARRFAAETGTTPGKWLLAQRLHHARELLEATDLPDRDRRLPRGVRLRGAAAPPLRRARRRRPRGVPAHLPDPGRARRLSQRAANVRACPIPRRPGTCTASCGSPCSACGRATTPTVNQVCTASRWSPTSDRAR